MVNLSSYHTNSQHVQLYPSGNQENRQIYHEINRQTIPH